MPREAMALRATSEPMLMRKRRQLMVTVTRTPLRGMLRPGVVRASQVEAGRPRSRAKAQSWRLAVATSEMQEETYQMSEVWARGRGIGALL